MVAPGCPHDLTAEAKIRAAGLSWALHSSRARSRSSFPAASRSRNRSTNSEGTTRLRLSASSRSRAIPTVKIEQAASGQSMGLARVSNWKMLPRFTPGFPGAEPAGGAGTKLDPGSAPAAATGSGRGVGEDCGSEGSCPRTSSGKAISQIAARVV